MGRRSGEAIGLVVVPPVLLGTAYGIQGEPAGGGGLAGDRRAGRRRRAVPFANLAALSTNLLGRRGPRTLPTSHGGLFLDPHVDGLLEILVAQPSALDGLNEKPVPGKPGPFAAERDLVGSQRTSA